MAPFSSFSSTVHKGKDIRMGGGTQLNSFNLYQLDWHAINSPGIFKKLFLSERGWHPSEDSDSPGKNNPCSAEDGRELCTAVALSHCQSSHVDFWRAGWDKCLALNQGILGGCFRAPTAISCASSSPGGGLSGWASQENWLRFWLCFRDRSKVLTLLL